ncbi:MAG: MFS transporter [Actinomycetota bacterium]|nr:MFS transporter [Actinomycetota bacterium]
MTAVDPPTNRPGPGGSPAGSRPAAPDEPSDDGYPRRLLVTTLLAIVAFSSSMTIVSASLPVIADDLDSTEGTLSWAVTGLLLGMAVGTPVMGKLGDILGHRKVFLIGAGALTVGTALCAVAPTAGTFIGFRIFVGLGISATMPTAMALIMASFPVSERPVAMGWFQMAMTGAPVVGLVIGGPAIEAFGWRTVFYALTPLSAFGFVRAWQVIRPSERRTDVSIDWLGAATLGTGTLSVLLALERGSAAGFGDVWFFVLLALGAVAIVSFVVVESRAAEPLLKLRYFRRRNFSGPLVAQPLAQFAYMGGFLIAPILLDYQFGLSVGVIALVLLFRPGAFSVSSPIGGRLAVKLGERLMLLSGSVLMVASMMALAGAALADSLPLVVAGLVFSGVALGISAPSYNTTLADAVDPEDLGIANGMGTTLMNIGMVTGIQAMFVVLGEGRDPGDFATVFVFGGIVAALGIAGALVVRPVDHDDLVAP